MAQKVQDRSPEVEAMAAHWPIVEALLGGTLTMRRAAKAHMPQWPGEEDDSYVSRLATATLFPALERTLGVMSGKPFAKELSLGEDIPPKLVAWCDNVDLQGNSLHAFSASLLDEALAYGLCGILVDYPRVGQIRTQAEETSIGARPYFIDVKHNHILGWRQQRVNGAMQLTQLRLAETKEVPDGEFGVKHEPRVRVLFPGGWEVYKPGERPDALWVIEDYGVTPNMPVIPFVPFYGRRLGFMNGRSPLQSLAHLNVKHWQSQSDQDTIMHVARVPILVAVGIDDETWEMKVGASSAAKVPKDADVKFVEHTGAAIESGAKSLLALEQQMIQTGAELLVKMPGQRTATESSNDAEANKSELQRIVEWFEDSLDQALQFMAMWVKEPQGGHATLYKDFGAATLSDASAQLVLSMQQGGAITKKTLLIEQQRRGVLSPDLDADAELEAVSQEGPALGTIDDGAGGGNGQ